MVWEHRHIADRELELKFPDQKVSLRQLFNLDKLKDVPETWPGQNYDYFWIVEFGNQATDVPTSFRSVQQQFTAPLTRCRRTSGVSARSCRLGNKCLP